MAIDVFYDDGCAYINFIDTIDLDNLFTHSEKLYQLEKKHEIKKRLVNFGEAVTIDMTFEKVLIYKNKRMNQNPTGKTALVVHNSVQKGFARMWQEIIKPIKLDIQVFESVDAAKKWLNEND